MAISDIIAFGGGVAFSVVRTSVPNTKDRSLVALFDHFGGCSDRSKLETKGSKVRERFEEKTIYKCI